MLGEPAEPLDRSFDCILSDAKLAPLVRTGVTTLQINIGNLCNQACVHCHVGAGPRRTKAMSEAVGERVMALLEASDSVEVVDFTGGAPELNPNFRWMVRRATELRRNVIDRCNLTVLFESEMEDLPVFLAQQRVRVVASLPCYTAENVDAQRGKGVFDKSIQALERLNELGYGDPQSGLELDLVYNPAGAFLPPPQHKLQNDYRRELGNNFGVRFNRLLTLTNLPIKRFRQLLGGRSELNAYVQLLTDSFNPETVCDVMCRSLVSVAWDGTLFDCDFNQMLQLPARAGHIQQPLNVFTIESLDELRGEPIVTGPHCFGCTAGAGSSCGGALTE